MKPHVNLTPEQETLCEAALLLISEGNLPLAVTKMLGGMPRSTLIGWLEHPKLSLRYARARDACWDARAEALAELMRDHSIDAKSRRVIADTELRLLSRWCPDRYGETLLLKRDDTGEETPLTTDEIVQRLALVAKRPVPLQIAHSPDIVDAEYTDAS